jgi:hypothetical protein
MTQALSSGSTRYTAEDDIESNATDHDNETESAVDRTAHIGLKRVHPWSRVHSYFTLMGGFTFKTSATAVNILPNDRTRLTLTTLALHKMALNTPEVIPDISEELIWDKSKSNSLAKCLICLQACWFIAQEIGRLVSAYPISLLEMNALLHAVCCLVTYFAW